MPRKRKNKNLPESILQDQGLTDDDSRTIDKGSQSGTVSTTFDSFGTEEIPYEHDIRYGHVGDAEGSSERIYEGPIKRRRSKLSIEQQEDLLKGVLPPKIGTDPTKSKTRRRHGEHIVSHRTDESFFHDDPVDVPMQVPVPVSAEVQVETQVEQAEQVEPTEERRLFGTKSTLANTRSIAETVFGSQRGPEIPKEEAHEEYEEIDFSTAPTKDQIYTETVDVEPEPEIPIADTKELGVPTLGEELNAQMSQPSAPITPEKSNVFEMAPEKLVDADFMHEEVEPKPIIPKVDLEEIKSGIKESRVGQFVWKNKIAFSIAVFLFLISAFFLFKPAAEPNRQIPIPQQTGPDITLGPDQSDVTVTLPSNTNGSTQFDQNGNPTGTN